MPDEVVLPSKIEESDLQAVRLLNERSRVNEAEQARYEQACDIVRTKLGLSSGAEIPPEVAQAYGLDAELIRINAEAAAQAADAAVNTAALKTKYSLDNDDDYDLQTGLITRNS